MREKLAGLAVAFTALAGWMAAIGGNDIAATQPFWRLRDPGVEFSLLVTLFWICTLFVFLENLFSFFLALRDEKAAQAREDARHAEQQHLTIFAQAVEEAAFHAREGARDFLYADTVSLEDFEQAMSFHLRAVARSAAFFDKRQDDDARYAANVMIFVSSDKADYETLLVTAAPQETRGVLLLRDRWGTYANSAAQPDYDLGEFSIPIPKNEEQSTLLPGAPATFLDPQGQACSEDTDDVIARCKSREFGEASEPLRQYFEKSRDRIRSWTSRAIRDHEQPHRPAIGVLNIHSDREGTLGTNTDLFFKTIYGTEIEISRYVSKIVSHPNFLV